MNSSNVYHIKPLKQDRQEAINTMKGISLTNLLHSTIREYGTYHDGSYSVDVRNLDFSDKKIVVSHYESAEWYEWACQSPYRIESLFDECRHHFQDLIDEECHEVYMEDQEEMRAYK